MMLARAALIAIVAMGYAEAVEPMTDFELSDDSELEFPAGSLLGFQRSVVLHRKGKKIDLGASPGLAAAKLLEEEAEAKQAAGGAASEESPPILEEEEVEAKKEAGAAASKESPRRSFIVREAASVVSE
eukprot:gnl/TRDRNA2_/TRDRNA2_186365_c0_seq1.p1 gnl/TRDRNA2_/TRDRNA2_186365_c0~~gnl/TRDRNA2_/TRDRNA2_186365_c0_seq1.p1  ORF type:complete len:129 (+),score=50.19 gnl/TRDRNA2_/TRDRNA2_186365_c0_seq1:97-483(+)